MRKVDDGAIARAAAVRRRSEYDYGLFEYLRSPKILENLEAAGVEVGGRLLDAGCGAGGTAISFAEEGARVVGLDLDARFRGSGTRLVDEKGVSEVRFVQGDGARLPFADGAFDFVLSHEVVEHVYAAEAYLRECHRVLRAGGILYLSTAPYLSLTGAHLPRLRVPVPLHLLIGRRAAFAVFRFLGRHAPFLLKEKLESSSFLMQLAQGRPVRDSLLQHITVRRLSTWLEEAGFRTVWEHHRVTGFFQRALPSGLRGFLARVPWIQDVMIGHIECVLRRGH
ncbi:MAG TPA: methyltransferase domain-containing protein [Vicinamibacteria bacterium]|nr:methyltransferase domain-containing protein [Vicinamibacteria bacterium]